MSHNLVPRAYLDVTRIIAENMQKFLLNIFNINSPIFLFKHQHKTIRNFIWYTSTVSKLKLIKCTKDCKVILRIAKLFDGLTRNSVLY